MRPTRERGERAVLESLRLGAPCAGVQLTDGAIRGTITLLAD